MENLNNIKENLNMGNLNVEAISNSILFSVIIPHKNTPDLLKRCLDSIPRTEGIQVIVVDDNSCKSIVDFNELTDLKDGFVEVYLTKEGKGAGYARNVGMKYAKGKWLLFADADDFFTENAFEHLFAQADVSEDIVYFKSSSCYSDTGEPAKRELKYNKLIDDFIEKKQYAEDRLRYIWNTPWAKMIKRELVEHQNILFDEIPIANDLIFSCHIGHHAASVKAEDKVIYMITVSLGSLTNTQCFKLHKIKFVVFFRRNRFLRKIGKKHICPSLIKRLFQKTLGCERMNTNNYKVKNMPMKNQKKEVSA